MYGPLIKLIDNMQIGDDVNKLILDRKKIIAQCIGKSFWDKDTEQSTSQFLGAYGRGTAIYTDEIKLLVYLPNSLFIDTGINNIEILGQIKTSLASEYRSSDIDNNCNGIQIGFSDDINFDVIPAFKFENGVINYYFNHRWKKINIGKELSSFNSLDKVCKGNLRVLCKLLKVWKSFCNVNISNILLDTFAYHFFRYNKEKKYAKESYEHMISDFFYFLSKVIGQDDFVSIDGETILQKTEDITDKVNKSYISASSAILNIKVNEYEYANKEYEKIFGHLI